MTKSPRKLSFREAWESSTVFYVDEKLENEIDAQVSKLLHTSEMFAESEKGVRGVEDIASFLLENPDGLDVILRDMGLSDEKFKRIISLLRKTGKIKGDFSSEWSMANIKNRIKKDLFFAKTIAWVVLDGAHDPELGKYIPRYYLEKLNYREIMHIPKLMRKIRYKESAIGTYGARKGHCVEAQIQERLESIRSKTGIGFEKGRSRFINVDIDFAVPSLADPWIIIMSSFQETTSSGQTTKARDMLAAYTRINESNSRFAENRIFINFVDGGGWLARKRDFERLVEQCHYYLNLNHLDMLEGIITMHVQSSRIRAFTREYDK